MQESGKRKKRNSMVALHASRTIDILGITMRCMKIMSSIVVSSNPFLIQIPS
jgi:hypothetical protein